MGTENKNTKYDFRQLPRFVLGGVDFKMHIAKLKAPCSQYKIIALIGTLRRCSADIR